ncbi:MAG: F-type H+-transporting ATPase subunit a [Acidimicrobiaceae bacterium]|nr:F-type H+-transporting ATPase subunit a [Acidimicrobiaceae bacterium]MDQ1446443.1 F-type H+-transporting ATPase subunit a [Acidimicrobiaceae bacterium]
MHLLALDFPGIDHIVKFKPIFGDGTLYEFNKVTLICVLAAVATLVMFLLAGSKGALVPTGVQNIVESAVEFVREGIVLQTMGPSGLGWMPYLTTLFFFIFFCNIFEIIPIFQIPATARMAIPLFLALLSWVIFIVVGIINQGPLGYFKSSLFPPGVPTALYILVTPIEFISTFLVRPFSLAVRLFANMLAGHILLVTFSVLSAALLVKGPLVVVMPLPAVMLVFLTGFEVLVAVLQAYIFTILTAVYIGGAMHPEH